MEAGCTVVRTTGHAPFYAWPGIDVRYTPAIGLFEWHGYQRAGEAVNMSVKLSDLDLHVDLPADLEVRRATAADREPLVAAIAASWTEDDWSAEIAAAFELDDAGVWLVLQDGEIAGFAAYGVTHPNVGVQIGVWPKSRGREVGLMLMKRMMFELREAGKDEGEFLWVGPVAYFSKHANARINRVFWIYEKAL